MSLPHGYSAICGCDSVESRTDESGTCTWDFSIRKTCAAGIGWAVGTFLHAHSQEMLRVHTSPHLGALAPSVCVGISRAMSVARSFLLDLVHDSEKVDKALPISRLPHSPRYSSLQADVRARCSRGKQLHSLVRDSRLMLPPGVQILLLPQPLFGHFPWGPWLSFYGLVVLGCECAHDGRRSQLVSFARILYFL
jgi:hypothetical protein